MKFLVTWKPRLGGSAAENAVYPVLDVEEAVGLLIEAVEFRKSVT